MARRWRLYHRELPDEAGAVVDLDADEAHHTRRVLRLEAGEAVTVFDGKGLERRGQLVQCDGGRVRVELMERIEETVDPALEVVLFQAMCRPDRLEWVLQKGTEIGLAGVHPWRSERSDDVRLTPTRLRRFERIVIEASKQCGRRRAPRIDPREALPAVPENGVLALVLQPGPGTPPIGARLGGASPEAVWIAVGPESGFEEGELAGLDERGWRPAGLGPRTLRTESAGLVAATLVLHRWGDLGRV